MAKNIGDLAVDIIASFHSLLGALEDSDDDPFRKRLQYKFRDQLARFKVWSGDTGALDRGQDSLESRLRDASHIRTQILELLNDLGQSLKDARDIIASFQLSWNGLNDKEEFPVDVDAETEGTEIAEDITDLVDGLSRLGCSIHNPAPHDELVASKVTDAESFEQQDIQHVRTKFAGIKYYLARRLGKAMSRRREYFQYLKTSQPGFRSRGNANESQFGPNLKPLLTPEQVKRIISAGDLSDDDDSDLGDSQSIHQTPGMASQKTKVPKVAQPRLASMFTSLLKGATDISVECPYCCTEVSEASAGRPQTIQLFGRGLRNLREQLLDARRVDATHGAKPPANIPLSSALREHVRLPVRFAKHLARDHPESIPEHHVDTLIRLSSEPLDPDTGVSCPMCLENLPSLKDYKKHVGCHLVSLALIALPEMEGPERDQDQGDDGIEGVALDTGVIQDTKQPPRGRSQQPPAGEKSTGVTPGIQRSTSPLDDSWQPRVYLPSQRASVSRARPYVYSILKEGINREVIAVNICKYLGPDATVRPGSYTNPSTGQIDQVYYVTSWKNLTTAMIDDLKADSVRWEAERQRQAPRIDGDSDLSAQPARPARLGNKALRYDASPVDDFNNELPNHEIQDGLLGQPSRLLVNRTAANHIDLPFDLVIDDGIDPEAAKPASSDLAWASSQESSAGSVIEPLRARDMDVTRPYVTQPSYSSSSMTSYPYRRSFNVELPNHETQSSLLGQSSWLLVHGAAADHEDRPFDLAFDNSIDLDTAYPTHGSTVSSTAPSFARDIDATHPHMTRPSFSSTSGASYPSLSAQSIPHRRVPWARGSWACLSRRPAAAASNSDDSDTRAEIPIAEMYTQMSHSDWVDD